MTSPNLIADRIATITAQLPPGVKLLAVSKYASTEAIRAAYAAGVRDFGESRVQDGLKKMQELSDLHDISWHMIGSLQSNKARLAVQNFAWIHSVDRLGLAQKIDRLVAELNKNPAIFLQVKLAPDPHKSGWHEAELLADLPELAKCQNLNIVGLMTILPLGLDDDQAYQVFSNTAALAEKLRSLGWQNIQQLSMGMSGDYHMAVKAGATLVRIGSSIFARD
jgi:pyridoxal phosphate enzyme (YggS family)